MGHQTIIFGYMELDPSKEEFNYSVIKNYQFDKVYPFTNIFSKPRAGYQASMVSFAGSYKQLKFLT